MAAANSPINLLTFWKFTSLSSRYDCRHSRISRSITVENDFSGVQTLYIRLSCPITGNDLVSVRFYPLCLPAVLPFLFRHSQNVLNVTPLGVNVRWSRIRKTRKASVYPRVVMWASREFYVTQSWMSVPYIYNLQIKILKTSDEISKTKMVDFFSSETSHQDTNAGYPVHILMAFFLIIKHFRFRHYYNSTTRIPQKNVGGRDTPLSVPVVYCVWILVKQDILFFLKLCNFQRVNEIVIKSRNL